MTLDATATADPHLAWPSRQGSAPQGIVDGLPYPMLGVHAFGANPLFALPVLDPYLVKIRLPPCLVLAVFRAEALGLATG